MKTLPYCVMTLKNPIMGCKHELHRCRNGDSSRAASAFVQFAVVINTTVRIFLYVRFKVAALKLLRQMHSMRRGRIREDQAPLEGVSLFLPHFFSPPQPSHVTSLQSLIRGRRAIAFPAQQTSCGIYFGK